MYFLDLTILITKLLHDNDYSRLPRKIMHNNSVIILADKAGEEFVYAVVWKFY